jgi:biotin-[acetyl-CoA-carboxylase] ligase BirA-like protein
MPWKEPLVGTHRLPRDDVRSGLELEHLVEEEERLPVGDDRLDLGAAEGRRWHRIHERQGSRRTASRITLLVYGAVAADLAPDAVLPLLRGRFGRPYLYVDRCESTQLLLTEDSPEGAVAVADEQTAGRGRLGRTWLARPGTSLLVSVALRPAVPTARLPELSLVAGRAVADAIAQVTGLEPALKFPNDVLLEGGKVAGILAEAREGRVVLGIGVNVNVDAVGVPEATALSIALGRTIDRAELLAAVLAALEARYDAWVRETATRP